MHAHVAQDAFNGMIAQISVAAMQLQAAIDHLETRIGGKTLGLGRKARRGGLALPDGNRGAMQQQARGLKFGRVVGHAKLQRLEIRKARAELFAFFHVGDRAVETELRTADRAGTDIQPAAVEARHRNLEALPFGPIRFATGTRQFSNMTIAVGWLFQPSFFSCAPNERPGVPFSTTMHEIPRGPALPRACHHDVDVGNAAAGNECLCAVEHIVLAVARRACAQACRIRTRVRLRQAITCEMLHRAKLRKKFPARRGASESIDHPPRHIVNRHIGCGGRATLAPAPRRSVQRRDD